MKTTIRKTSVRERTSVVLLFMYSCIFSCIRLLCKKLVFSTAKIFIRSIQDTAAVQSEMNATPLMVSTMFGKMYTAKKKIAVV